MNVFKKDNRDIDMFIIGYLVFYIIISLPLPLRGDGSWLRVGLSGFVEAFLSYLLLLRFYLRKKTTCIAIVAATIFLNYSLAYCIELLFRSISINQYFDETYHLTIALVLYGILFFAIRQAGLKNVNEQQLQIVNFESILNQYRMQIPQEALFKRLDKIKDLINDQSPEALSAIAELSDQLKAVIYNDETSAKNQRRDKK